MRDELTKHTRIKCGLDARERPLHCHHEKTIVVDDRVAFVGRIDLTSQAGDRFDASELPVDQIPANRPGRSTSSGSGSARNSSNDGAAASRSRTVSSACRTSRDERGASSGRSTASSLTAEAR
jgi:hypothetical protein